MKIYLIIEWFYDEATIHAVETDPKKAEKLYKIFSEVNSDIHLEEYDTDKNIPLLNGQVPYRVQFTENGDKKVSLGTDERDFVPGVTEFDQKYVVRVYAASKDEACKIASDVLRGIKCSNQRRNENGESKSSTLCTF